MNDEISVCCALLHDVIEDTHITYKDLNDYGILDEMMSIIDLSVHADALSCSGSITRVMKALAKQSLR
ncbi:MAG: hypothetical protein FWG21_00770 [Oscillospiraceae bacterium]|nr:hypothetical protein [Oscillospiraceae bacterium]